MQFDSITYFTNDGRTVKLSEPDDHILQLEIEGQVIARFSQAGTTIENIQQAIDNVNKRN